MWWFWFWKWVLVAGRTQGRLWILVFCLGIMGVLVPAPLLEFRYFTIPFFLIALHTKIPEEIELGTSFCMTILYLVLNAFTMYLFLFRPFHWANDPGGIQRFMWWKFCHLLFSHITWILKLYLCLEIKFDWYRQTQHSWFCKVYMEVYGCISKASAWCEGQLIWWLKLHMLQSEAVPCVFRSPIGYRGIWNIQSQPVSLIDVLPFRG